MSHNIIQPPQLTVQGFPARSGAYIPKTVQAQQYLIVWRNAGSDAPDAWLRAIICEAFKRMVARRMPDTPAADMIAAVADDWMDIVGEGMNEEQDLQRIIAGFKLIFRECSRWPQPAELLKRLPWRIAKQAATIHVDAVDEGAHERSAAELNKILESLG
jgi:hypothetical protein